VIASSILALIGLGFALGLRHGIDWDHIAAITDITGSVVTTEGTSTMVLAPAARSAAVNTPGTLPLIIGGRKLQEVRESMFLATLYAFGHALVVVVLGLLALWAGTVLPEWVDPVMERIVGITLLLLGFWIFYSIWRYGRSFRLQSRWMLVFSLMGRGWSRLKNILSGHPIEHSHDLTQYGPKTAFSIGMIHGIGAETGSQALLLAGAAGATSTRMGSLMLLAFVVGLIISNSLIAAFSTFGFVSSSTKRNVYMVIGILAGLFSLVVGAFFVTGQGTNLPDLQAALTYMFGSIQSPPR
jgi:high-affinity nickel-transport protein